MDSSIDSFIPPLSKLKSLSSKAQSSRPTRRYRRLACPSMSIDLSSEQEISSSSSKSLGNRSILAQEKRRTSRDWEYQSKHAQKFFSSPPFHPDFFLAKSEQRFDDHFASKEFIVEKDYDVDDMEVLSILKEAKLDLCTNLSGPVNQSLVSEFYANLSTDIADEDNPVYHRVFVRGVWIKFYPTEINKVLGAPDNESLYSPELSREHISIQWVISALTNGLVKDWPEGTSLIPRAQLPTTFAQLLKLSKEQWIPLTHGSNFNPREAMLMYILVMEPQNFNIGAVIFENIVQRSTPHLQRLLIHPVLITKLLQSQDVPSRESDTIISSSGSLGTNARLSQGFLINDLPKTPVQDMPPSLKALVLKEVEGCQLEISRLQFRVDGGEN